MTQQELDDWYETAQDYFPDDDSKREGYLAALEDLADREGLEPPSRPKA